MKLVQREAVKRIDCVSYSNDRITSYSAPEDTEWVVSEDMEQSIKRLNGLLVRIWNNLLKDYCKLKCLS